MHKIITYIKHLFTATNQHGVHSPFVYDFITKCVYQKVKYKGSKSDKVLLNSILYFNSEKLNIISSNSNIKNIISQEFHLKTENTPPFDLIYEEQISENLLPKYERHLHNNSVLVVKHIHLNQNSSNIWKKTVTNKRITASIDMYFCGVLFFRKEQVKEHFRIRI